MIATGIAAFWSYSHEDNELDGGGIAELAEDLRREFALVTGETLTLFIDRTAIGWGDEWRRRIDDALTDTTFFIPIITPRYFSRDECRRELLDFNAQAQSLGMSELILPVRYAKVKDLADSNSDEAIALVARMQYVDWTQLRLKGASSPEYRAAVNDLASRLAELGDIIAERQISDELKEVESTEDDEPGLIDIFSRINEIFPGWVEAMEAAQIVSAQFSATWGVYSERLRKIEKSGPPSALFSVLQRLAVDELVIAERKLSLARTYAAKTIELDPLVLAAARLGSSHPSERAIFADLCTEIKKIEELVRKNNDMSQLPGAISAKDWAQQRAHISKTIQRLAQIWATCERTVAEANQIVNKWSAELEWLDPLSDK